MIYNPQGLIHKQPIKIRKGSLGIARDRNSQQGEYMSKGLKTTRLHCLNFQMER